MIAYDSNDQLRRATADVSVFVTRNPSGPVFIQDPYQVTINEVFPLGDVVVNTTAVDSDGVCTKNNKIKYGVVYCLFDS